MIRLMQGGEEWGLECQENVWEIELEASPAPLFSGSFRELRKP